MTQNQMSLKDTVLYVLGRDSTPDEGASLENVVRAVRGAGFKSLDKKPVPNTTLVQMTYHVLYMMAKDGIVVRDPDTHKWRKVESK